MPRPVCSKPGSVVPAVAVRAQGPALARLSPIFYTSRSVRHSTKSCRVTRNLRLITDVGNQCPSFRARKAYAWAASYDFCASPVGRERRGPGPEMTLQQSLPVSPNCPHFIERRLREGRHSLPRDTGRTRDLALASS